jgi:hypothetical protein
MLTYAGVCGQVLIAHGCDIDVRDNEVLSLLALLVQKEHKILTLTLRLPGRLKQQPYAPVCSRMLTYAAVAQRLKQQPYADVC